MAPGSRFLPSTQAACVAAKLRAVILSHIKDPIPEEVSGIRPDGAPTTDPHAAFIPLPYAGFPHADGRILGIAVSMPRSLTDESRRAVYRAIGSWEDSHRTGETVDEDKTVKPGLKLGDLCVSRQIGPEPLVSLRRGTWSRKSRRWVSVTPISLPRHPGSLGKGSASARAAAWRKAESAVMLSCEHVGLPRPLKVVMSHDPFTPGSYPAARYPPFTQKTRDGSPIRRKLIHASLTFEEAVAGPMMIGTGRFAGLGLMYPMPRWRLGVMMDKDSKAEDPSISSEVEEFAEFFRCVHGYDPFPWQARLMKQVLMRGKWPDVIDLPTGTGKTAVLDVAVFAMSRRPETSPRRIVFVVDRRIVVDQVYKRAQKIQDKIRGGDSGVLARVRERLKECGGGDESLGIAMLRGGIPIDSEWARRPDQPWVMVSTVDQFGSCLLFRGYMASKRMRPIYAGLAGNDCLVVLDEVHLSLPFAHHHLRIWPRLNPVTCRAGLRWLEMSATPSDADAERFGLDRATDLDGCEELSRRVGVAKPAELVLVT